MSDKIEADPAALVALLLRKPNAITITLLICKIPHFASCSTNSFSSNIPTNVDGLLMAAEALAP